jgi:hypothetical protein
MSEMENYDESPTRIEEHPASIDVAAIERRAGDISEDDVCVSVIGTVISRNPNTSSITLDDGSGQIDVKLSMIPELGSLVRVVARVVVSEGGITLDATIVQDFSCFDVDLYRRIVELEERVYSREGDYHLQG